MKYQIEFEGRKLSQTECKTYSEARLIMYKIARQCIEAYRKICADHKYDQARENRLQIRIIEILKIRPIACDLQPEQLSLTKAETKIESPIPAGRISQIHRSYAEVG